MGVLKRFVSPIASRTPRLESPELSRKSIFATALLTRKVRALTGLYHFSETTFEVSRRGLRDSEATDGKFTPSVLIQGKAVMRLTF